MIPAYELRLGVTGHRDLPPGTALVQAVEALLDRLEATLGADGPPVSWTVISPLARGADRVVASAVLQRARRAGGEARLEVVTPFPLERYREDFPPGPDRDEFEALYRQAAQVEQLAGTPARGYAAAGERVVDACEILIAIWDETETASETAATIEYALQRERVVLWLDPRRDGAPASLQRDLRRKPFPRSAERLSRGFYQRAAYHRDTPDAATCEQAARDLRTRLAAIAESPASGLPAEALEPFAQLIPAYVKADELARRYRRRHELVVNGIPFLAAFAVTVGVFQVLFFPEQRWVIAFEVAAMVGLLCLWLTGRQRRWHEKWLYDRYLAERLRTAMFTAPMRVAAAAAAIDDPLPFYRGPHQWLAGMAGALAQQVTRLNEPLPVLPLRTFVVDAWLRDQQRHHHDTARRLAASGWWRQWLGVGLFATTLIMATLHMLVHPENPTGPLLRRWDIWFTFLALALPSWAAAVHAATSPLEMERIAERSERMAAALGLLVTRGSRVDTPDDLRAVMADAARLMSMENHEWWVLLSFQDPKLQV